jgi:hypothetical protein
MSRIALIVGISQYPENPLHGCAQDALELYELLKNNGEEEPTKNFETIVFADQLKKGEDLHAQVRMLFSKPCELALFYFSGHGSSTDVGGHLVAHDQETKRNVKGISMRDVMFYASKSPATAKVIILDCCFSGDIGRFIPDVSDALIAEGTIILAASRGNEYSAMDADGNGSVFTNLLRQGLEGGASDLLGNISPASLYAFADQSLGNWDIQRPVFKANVDKLITLRKVKPPIATKTLAQISKIFNSPTQFLGLDPSWEPTDPTCKKSNAAKFKMLQSMNRVGLVVPVDEEHMYYAAMHSTGCRLTALGRHYWNLSNNNRF